MYSGLAAYSSGVKHQGKMPRMVISATLGKALAMVCQPSTTVFMKRSVFGQLLCRESDFTFAGYFAASHVPTAEPRDTPEMCADCNPNACMKAAISSARSSVE